MSHVQAVGIDLGTTYSAVAFVDSAGRTAMIRSAQGDLLTPSVVLFEDDETYVGRSAKKFLTTAPDRVAECVKRDMGSSNYSRPIRGQMLPPEVIQACILRKLKTEMLSALGPNIKVVITVPAFFDEPRRKATVDAGEMAGLDVLNIVNEPTAAALAFGERLGYLSTQGAPSEEMRVLVYDLGGGTFDVTVIQLKPGEITTLATEGDVRLGGYDWDTRLCDYAAEAFKQCFEQDPREDLAGAARLRAAVEEAKHTLTARGKATLPIAHGGQQLELVVTTELFEELTEDLLERTRYTTRHVLQAAGLEWSDLSRVLLVGGSSRMPMVGKMLRQLTGIEPDNSVNPDEAVARGAAIFAEYLLASSGRRPQGPKFQVNDVNAHSLGIEGIDPRTQRKENTILIPRNTPLPTQVQRKFITKVANQPSVVVQVLEGESKDPAQCAGIGRAVLRNLPPLPESSPIDVFYRYDAHGRLSIRAKVIGTGNEMALELQRTRNLSSAGVRRWREALASDSGFKSVIQQIRDTQPEAETAASAPQADRTEVFPSAELKGDRSQLAASSNPAGRSTAETAAITPPALPASASQLASTTPQTETSQTDEGTRSVSPSIKWLLRLGMVILGLGLGYTLLLWIQAASSAP